MSMNIYEIEEHAILQCTDDDLGNVNTNMGFDTRGGLCDNL